MVGRAGRRKIKKVALRIAGMSAAVLAAYAALLNVPQPLFSYSVRADTLRLYSDRPVETAAAAQMLELAETKLARSPLWTGGGPVSVFVCNARWRQRLLFNTSYGVGGVVFYPFSPHVFLRDASIGANRLISPSGKLVAGNRTLDYFIAHEVAHLLTGRALGPACYARLPQWVREGYADYVGKGSDFQYEAARQALLAGAPEMDWSRSGLYTRFHLLVAYELDRQGWSVMRLLKNPPPQQEVEAAVRAGAAGR